MATCRVDENNISQKNTAFLGMGQFFSCCSQFNYNLSVIYGQERTNRRDKQAEHEIIDITKHFEYTHDKSPPMV
jgi:hypothetical protein